MSTWLSEVSRVSRWRNWCERKSFVFSRLQGPYIYVVNTKERWGSLEICQVFADSIVLWKERVEGSKTLPFFVDVINVWHLKASLAKTKAVLHRQINFFIFQWSEFLGPLLFLLYVNDLPQSLSDAGSYLYADGTCIFYQHKDVKKIGNVLDK